MSETTDQPDPKASAALATDITAPSTASPSLFAGVLRLSLVARLLALAGAVLFALAAWMPWARTIPGPEPMTPSFSLDPAHAYAAPLSSFFDPQGAVFVWSAITVLGILLCPLVWQSAVLLHARIAALAYGLWALVATIIAISLDRALAVEPGVSGSPGPGFWAVLFALLLMWSASILLLLEMLAARSHRSESLAVSVARYPRRQLPGAGVLTVGLLLWGYGTLAMPWATVNCTGVPLVSASCMGLPFTGVLDYAIGATTPLFDPLVSLYAVSILLAGGALLILISAWRRASSLARCSWVSLWLLAATFLALLARDGVDVVMGDPTSQRLPAGAWSGDTGILVTFLGLFAVFIGAMYLWIGLLWPRLLTTKGPTPAAE